MNQAELSALNAVAFSLPRIANALEKIAQNLEALTATKFTLPTMEEMTDEQRETFRRIATGLPGGIVSPGPSRIQAGEPRPGP